MILESRKNSSSELHSSGVSKVKSEMKTTTVIVPWKEGMHLRRAGSLVQLAMRFRSSILCRLGEKVADGRSVIAILILCAGLGTTLEIEASGPDEREAIRAVDAFFASNEESKS
jgi:phosphotransferase system HPr (HPr) family protein